MNGGFPTRNDQAVMRLAAAKLQANADELERLARTVDAEVRRCHAVLVHAKLDRIMRSVRKQ